MRCSVRVGGQLSYTRWGANQSASVKIKPHTGVCFLTFQSSSEAATKHISAELRKKKKKGYIHTVLQMEMS